MTALVTSAVTLVTVLLSLLSIDSMFRLDLEVGVKEVVPDHQGEVSS